LDIKENKFTYCNAGHDQPIHIKSSECEQLLSGGIPLGFLSDFNYSASCTTLSTNDIIIIYTDGVTEAMNHEEEEYGMDNFKRIICENKTASASDLLNILLDAINTHTKGAPQMDDITLVILKKE
ncbi:MAG: PP2C family protein-serine/threonine phosphatase, partial [Calditrichaceae bacterium]